MSLPTRILIVEDEEVLAGNLREYFLRRAADVRVVSSGERAVECTLDFAPDLVLIDYGLPGRNGLDTFADLSRIWPQVRSVLMTGHPTDAIFRAAHDSGIGRVLEKPFPFAALEGLVPDSSLAPAAMAGDGFRMSATRRRGDRRSAGASASLPFLTADGEVSSERRGCDRRAGSERREAATAA